MINRLKKSITKNLLNIPGYRTSKKIVVIESDDWGSVRMASKDAFQYFKEKGYPVDDCPYNRNDALESETDLSNLFEVLVSIKDKYGHPAKMTTNCVVANPDFTKIAQSGYKEYFYEPFTETYKRYPNHYNSFQIFKQGVNAGLAKPQFHGREHLNVKRWMNSLQKGNQASLDAFSQNMFSVHQSFNPENKNEFMDALDFDTPEDAGYIEEVVKDGLTLFNHIWGFNSLTFIANCYIWHGSLEKSLDNAGVRYIQGFVVQKEPMMIPGAGKYIKRYHYQGQKNELGQHYLIRNASFEPSQNLSYDWVNYCLSRIETAFRWHKPAIISTHRVNYMGDINPRNRERNLKLLKIMLSKIIMKWPDAEFLSSDELGYLISNK